VASASENVEMLKRTYRDWHESKGQSVKGWLDLVADHIRVRSLAGGAPGVEFTKEARSKAEFAAYFRGLLADWEMIHYTVEQFIAEGDHVVMRGSTAWRNRKTRRVIDTPKADFWTFRDGKAVEFHEFYDTAGVLAALAPA